MLHGKKVNLNHTECLSVDAVELAGTSTSSTILRVAVEREGGSTAFAFLSVRMHRGRPRFTLTAKLKGRKEREVSASADWSDTANL